MKDGHPEEPSEGSLFERLQTAIEDPTLRSALMSARELEGRFALLDTDDIYAALLEINQRLDEAGMCGRCMKFTGRARVMIGDPYARPYLEPYIGNLPVQTDTIGDYYEIAGDKMIFGGLRIVEDDQLDSEPPRIAAVFDPAELYRDGEDDADFNEPLYALLSDIKLAQVVDPTYKGISVELHYYFPETLIVVDGIFVEGLKTPTKLLDALQKLRLPVNEHTYHGYPFAARLAEYLWERAQFDSEPYDITVKGEYVVVDDNEDCLATYGDNERKIRGNICGIDLDVETDEDGNEYYFLQLVVAVPLPEHRGNYCACLIPADSILSFRSTRMRRALIGDMAALNFGDPESVHEYFKHRHLPNDDV